MTRGEDCERHLTAPHAPREVGLYAVLRTEVHSYALNDTRKVYRGRPKEIRPISRSGVAATGTAIRGCRRLAEKTRSSFKTWHNQHSCAST